MADIYVDWATGNDTTGNGTQGNPYKTPEKAQSVVPLSGTNNIYMAPGTYISDGTAPVNAHKEFRISNIYTGRTTFRSTSANVNGVRDVIIRGDGTSNDNAIFRSADSQNVTFQGIQFGGAGGGVLYCMEFAGVNMAGVRFENCKFKGIVTTNAAVRWSGNIAVTQDVYFDDYCEIDMEDSTVSPNWCAYMQVTSPLYVCTATARYLYEHGSFRGIQNIGGRFDILGGSHLMHGAASSIPISQGIDGFVNTLSLPATGSVVGVRTLAENAHGIICGALATSILVAGCKLYGGNHGFVDKASLGTICQTSICWGLGNAGFSVASEYGFLMKGCSQSVVTGIISVAGSANFAALSNDDGDLKYPCFGNSFTRSLLVSITDGPLFKWSANEETNLTVIGATNASPIEVQFSAPHNFSPVTTNATRIRIVGVLGNTAANGYFWAKYSDVDKVLLYSNNTLSTPVAGTGAYTSGGKVNPDNYIDFNAYQVDGTGNYGSVEGVTNILSLAALRTAWANSGATGNTLNDLNSKGTIPEVQYYGGTGLDLYGVIVNADGEAWNTYTRAYETYDAANNWLYYSIPLWEKTAGYYIMVIPPILPKGEFTFNVYHATGNVYEGYGFQIASDPKLESQTYGWTGHGLVTPVSLLDSLRIFAAANDLDPVGI